MLAILYVMVLTDAALEDELINSLNTNDHATVTLPQN